MSRTASAPACSEQGTVDLLNEAGLGARMQREGLVHAGIEIRFDGRGHRIDFRALTGKAITVYGQHELVKDLIAARLAEGRPLHFEVSDVAVEGFDAGAPVDPLQEATASRMRSPATSSRAATASTASAGRACRHGVLTIYERSYPFAWMGILAEAPPASKELIYAHHERGFALLSMRSPTLSRLYVAVRAGGRPVQWPDERIWDELQRAHGHERRRLPRAAGRRPAEGHHAHAQLRRRAHAVRPAVPGRRRRPISCRRPAPRA